MTLARKFRLLFKPLHAGEGYYRNYANILAMDPGRLSIYAKLKASLGKAKRVLDLGCGTGYITHFLSASGADLNPTALGLAKKHFPKCRFRKAGLRELVKAGKRWDAVVCVNVLEHLEDADLDFFFENIGRLLTKNGRVHIVYDSMYHPLQLLSGLIHPGMLLTDPTHVHCWPQYKFRRLLATQMDLLSDEGGNILSLGLPWTNYFHSARLYVARPNAPGFAVSLKRAAKSPLSAYKTKRPW